jgi:hypothetical protein
MTEICFPPAISTNIFISYLVLVLSCPMIYYTTWLIDAVDTLWRGVIPAGYDVKLTSTIEVD